MYDPYSVQLNFELPVQKMGGRWHSSLAPLYTVTVLVYLLLMGKYYPQCIMIANMWTFLLWIMHYWNSDRVDPNAYLYRPAYILLDPKLYFATELYWRKLFCFKKIYILLKTVRVRRCFKVSLLETFFQLYNVVIQDPGVMYDIPKVQNININCRYSFTYYGVVLQVSWELPYCN